MSSIANAIVGTVVDPFSISVGQQGVTGPVGLRGPTNRNLPVRLSPHLSEQYALFRNMFTEGHRSWDTVFESFRNGGSTGVEESVTSNSIPVSLSSQSAETYTLHYGVGDHTATFSTHSDKSEEFISINISDCTTLCNASPGVKLTESTSLRIYSYVSSVLFRSTDMSPDTAQHPWSTEYISKYRSADFYNFAHPINDPNAPIQEEFPEVIGYNPILGYRIDCSTDQLREHLSIPAGTSIYVSSTNVDSPDAYKHKDPDDLTYKMSRSFVLGSETASFAMPDDHRSESGASYVTYDASGLVRYQFWGDIPSDLHLSRPVFDESHVQSTEDCIIGEPTYTSRRLPLNRMYDGIRVNLDVEGIQGSSPAYDKPGASISLSIGTFVYPDNVYVLPPPVIVDSVSGGNIIINKGSSGEIIIMAKNGIPVSALILAQGTGGYMYKAYAIVRFCDQEILNTAVVDHISVNESNSQSLLATAGLIKDAWLHRAQYTT